MKGLSVTSCLLFLAACGGSVTTSPDASTSSADGGHTSPDASAGSADAGATDGATDGAKDGASAKDGATCRTGAPAVHRPVAAACTPNDPDSGVQGCTATDACTVDSDCGSAGVCVCEAPRCSHPYPVSGNTCVPGNCHVDSDCACGFCAGDPGCGSIGGYWCTTPLDECSTGADCPSGSQTCGWSSDRWACVPFECGP